MRAANHPVGQGAFRRCGNPACTQIVDVNPTGRPRKFCSDQCCDEARRARNYRDFGTTVPHRSGVPRNPIFPSTKSNTYRGDTADRGSPVNGVLATVGVGVSPTAPIPTDGSARSRLIRAAIRTELGSRWPSFTNNSHRKP